MTRSDAERVHAGSIVGRVFDALAAPLAGAEVTFTPENGEVARTCTDRDGAFALAALRLGAGSLAVSASGRARWTGRVAMSEEQSSGQAALRLWDGARLDVHVRDAEGENVAGAGVVAYLGDFFVAFPDGLRTVEPWCEASEGTTDARGTVTFAELPLGAIRVVAWAPGYALLQHDLFLREDASVELELAHDARVSVVVSVSDVPAGCEVDVALYAKYDSDWLPLPDVLARGRLDAAGRWERTGLPRWWFAIGLQADGLAFVVDEEEGEQGEEVGGAQKIGYRAVRLEPVPLRGVLRDAQGDPVAGARLLARAACSENAPTADANTDAEGRFVLRALLVPGERANLLLVSDRLHLAPSTTNRRWPRPDAPTWYEVDADASQALELRAERTARAAGIVVDPRGEPLPLRRVVLQEVDTRGHPSRLATLYSARDGTFALAWQHLPGRELRFCCDDRGRWASRTFRLAVGETADDLRIVRDAGAVVEGSVRDGAGHGVPGARVLLTPFPRSDVVREHHETVMTDRHGRYRFPDVLPGKYKVGVARGHRGASARSAAFEVGPGARVTVDLLVS